MKQGDEKSRELRLFLALAAAGVAAALFHVHIPHTDVLIDGRWAFGFMGFALLRRWPAALGLAALLSYPYGVPNIPIWIGFAGNMLYAVPALLVIRPLSKRMLAAWGPGWLFGLGWGALVLVCYQVFITPAVWGVIALMEGRPVGSGLMDGWRTQPFLVESVLVALFSAAAMTAALALQRLRAQRRRLDHIYRVLLGIRNVNQLIVTEDDPQRLIEKACVNLTETMGYLNAWIALVDGGASRALGLSGEGAISASASAGIDGNFETLREQLERGKFPACMERALAADETIVSGDPRSDCPDCPLSGGYGGRAALVHRLSFGGTVYGTLAASVPAVYARDAEEHDLFNEVAGDLAFALHKIAVARKLEETHDRFRAVFEAANVGKSMTLPTGEVDVNRAFADMLGYTIEDLNGKTWQQLTPPEDVPETERRIAPLLDGREDSTRFEKRYVRKDGGTVWADVSVTLLRTPEGKPLHFITTVVNITERRLLEVALRESEKRCREVLDGMLEGCQIITPEWEYAYVNDAAARQGHRTRDELIGRTMMEVYPGIEDSELFSVLRRCFEERTPRRYDNEFIYPDGARGFFQLSIEPVPEGLFILSEEITRRKQAENRIQHLNLVLRAIRDVNQLITHETDRAALLRRSCEILVSTRGYRSAWVALCDAEGNLEDVAECGIGEDFGAVREALERGEWPECYRRALELPDGIAPMHGTAINCKTCALAHTYRDTAALAGRLRHAGRDYGVLVVALPERLADDEEEQSLFRELIGDVAYALHAMETTRQRRMDESRFRTYVEDAPHGVFIADRSGRYVEVNPAAADITGYSEDELLAMSIADLLLPEDREAGQASFQRLSEDGRISEEMPFVRKNGENRHWIVSAVKLSEDRFLGFAEDITERKHAEEALRGLIRLNSSIMHAAQDIIVFKDGNHIFRSANAAMCNLVGKTESEIIGKTDFDLFPYELAARYRNDDESVIESGRSFRCEEEVLSHEGIRYVSTIKAPVLDENKVCQGIVVITRDITERKRMENALWHSHELLRAVLDTIPAGIFWKDRDLKYLGCNLLFARDAGFEKPEDLVGKDDFAMGWREQAERYRSDDGAVMEDGEPRLLVEEPQTTPSGETIHVLTSKAPLRDAQGAVIGVLGTYMDITERKRAEELVREATMRLGEAIRAANVGLWDWDLITNRVYFSREWKEQIGYSEDEITDSLDEWRDRVHPDDLPTTLAQVEQMIAAGTTHSYQTEFRFRHKDGSYRWILAQSSILRDETGRAFRVLGSHIDLTEQKAREERVFLLGRMLDSAPACITIHDTDGHFLFANAANVAVHGYDSLSEFLQINRHDLDVPESEKLLAERFRKVAEEGEARFEVRHYRKDGSTFPLEILARQIEWEGRPAVLSIAADITERKRADEEREKLQSQLNQAQKMESVGRLAGGVAHDFNNILQAMMGYSQMLLDALPDDAAEHEYAGEIYQGVERAATLTRQLLAFARKQTIAPKVLDLNETVESMLKMLRRLIGEDIDLAWRPAGGLWQVKMDPGQIDQILANLCVNARDAIAGVGKVTIETGNATFDEAYCAAHADFVPGEFAMLAVSDDGCGMDKETLDSIFEPFFTTKGVSQGTGLGLATVYGIVKQNEGFINVYSEPGEGTTFRVYLPRHCAEALREEKRTETRVHEGNGETVLFVEDDPAILRLGERMLASMNYDVHAFGAAGDALEFARTKREEIHLLITDVVMPEMSGRELAEAIRHFCPGIRVLFMSGYTANVIAHRGVLDEGVNFLQKPFSPRGLARKVREALDSNQEPAD